MKFKIGQFNDSFPPTVDGVANAVFNYALILKTKYDLDVVVATPKYFKEEDHYPFKVIRYYSIKIPGSFPYRVGNPFAPRANFHLRKEKFDIIHVHSPFSAGILARILSLHKIPIIATYHTKFEVDFEKYLRVKAFRKIATRFILNNLNACDEVWVVSEGAGKSLQGLGYKGSYRIMPNGSDIENGRSPENEVRKLRKKHKIRSKELVLLFVGRMMWYKNTRLCFDAIRKAKEQGFPVKAIFVGEGKDRREMEKYVNQLQIDNIVQFTGMIQDRALLRTYYSMANLFLFPSSYDTSGLVVKEAAACSCPSLLVAGTCAAEGVIDGFSGFLAEQETSEAVEKKLIEALSDPDKLRLTGENANHHVYLSWEDAIDNAVKRYEQILLETRKNHSRQHAPDDGEATE